MIAHFFSGGTIDVAMIHCTKVWRLSMKSIAQHLALGIVFVTGACLFEVQPALSETSVLLAGDVVWRNVTRDRTPNSSYKNLATHPIQISVSIRSGTDGKRCLAKLWINDVGVASQFKNGAVGGGQLCSVTAIIPVKASYRVDTDEAPEDVVELWAELY